MPRLLKILLGASALLALLFAGAWLWLTAREPVPVETDYVITLDELRRLGGSIPGEKPLAIYSELVAEASLPRGAVFAGESLRTPHPMVHQAFQVRYPDGGFVLLDTAFPESLMQRMQARGGEGKYNPAAYVQVQTALAGARQIFVTHEHFDHLGGVGTHRDAAALPGRLKLTREQLANADALDEAGVPAALRERLEPLAFERVHAVAPGLVLQKAPGHTPGTLLAYVQLQDGVEYLFVGDVAWHLDQIVKEHYRPRLVTDYFLGEDRRAVLAQFRALSELMRANPQLVVVVSHDRDQRARLMEAQLLREGFDF
jgi:glyoxylase-like metal-dependent hydrolase (beta-lactamase superfamily II)